jgi:hypothetical protein
MVSKKKKNILAVGLAGLICMAVILFSPPAFSKAVEVPIGLNLELTGGLAATTIPVSDGLLDYIKYINDEGGFEYEYSGKMHQAKYDIMWADNGFTVARSLTNVRRFAQKGAKLILTA